MIELTWAKVEPFLSAKAKAMQTTTEPWLGPLQVLLNARYGDGITQEPDGGNEPLFVSTAADSINRRVNRPADADFVLQQAVASGSVRYNDRAAAARWFEPEELDALDAATHTGGVRTVRTPAPDGIRFGNRMRTWPYTDDESGEGDWGS